MKRSVVIRKILISGVFFLFFHEGSVKAQVFRLPDIFSDNMVLQQHTILPLWGWANPMDTIKMICSWDHDTLVTITSAFARWEIALPTPAAGGPYTIKVEGGNNSVVINNVLIGENWLCSGQSNMEFSASWKTMSNWQSDTAAAQDTQIRFFHINRITAAWPQTEVRGKWEICSPASMFEFSAVGYFFGRSLNEHLHVPIGLIESSWGGTPVEAWMPDSIFRNDMALAASAKVLKPVPWCPMVPAVCFNAMLSPLVHFPIAGVIWYQGETNVAKPGTYASAFSKMIRCWRNLWKESFPFYFVQIAPYNYGNADSAALLREAQLNTFRNIAGTGIVVTTDITSDTNNIHPTDKLDVGNRLASWALANNYKQSGIVYSGPLYRGMEVRGNKIKIIFDFASSGLKVHGGEISNLWIAGSNRKFYPAKALIRDSTLEAFSPMVRVPEAVRLGFSNTATPNLFNAAGLPASPFRTDDWPVQ
jgi:sialate O-acetylesterase